MENLEKIGFWYGNLPQILKDTYFSHLKSGEKTHISIDKQDEVTFKKYVETRTSVRIPGVYSDFLQFFVYYAMFENTGKRVVRVVDHSLKEALFNTDIGDLVPNDFHLPFDSFFVELGLNYQYIDGSTQTIEGAFILNHEDWIEVVALENLHKAAFPSFIYFTIYKDTSIKEQIHRIVSDIFSTVYKNAVKHEYKEKLENFDTGLISQITKLFSILFYLDYAQKEYKSSIVEKNEWKPFAKALTKGKAAQFNSKRNKAYHYIQLSAIKAPPSKNAESSTKSGYKQTKMALVRGHWKKQPYGSRENTQLTRIIWIKPYWKNLDSEMGPETHIYKI